jgi:hypothetical protein
VEGDVEDEEEIPPRPVGKSLVVLVGAVVPERRRRRCLYPPVYATIAKSFAALYSEYPPVHSTCGSGVFGCWLGSCCVVCSFLGWWFPLQVQSFVLKTSAPCVPTQPFFRRM